MITNKIENFTSVKIWLLLIYSSIFLMIIVGGLTRLTGSGLSMVNWEPIMGILPPLNEGDWLLTFEKYKGSPQFKLINYEMNLEGFKNIFWWEYSHRILGRLIGILYFVPFFYFVLIKKSIVGSLMIHCLLIGLLGGAQGVLGWYMVKSGLNLQPYVSHYRLAAHLFLALFVMMYTYWTYLTLSISPKMLKSSILKVKSTSFDHRLLGGLYIVVLLQILLGAFTAGLHAGVGYNTFPTMNGQWVPDKIFDLVPLYRNFLSNTVAIQFTHRIFGFLTLFLTLFFSFRVFMNRRSHILLKRGAVTLLVLVVSQFGLGIITLLKVVPITWASLHQIGAVLVISSLTYVYFVSVRLAKNK